MSFKVEKQSPQSKSWASRKKRLKQNRQMLLMCALPVLKIFIFSYLPMIGIIIAFKQYMPAKGIFGSPWIGFKNFEFFFKSNAAWTVLRNTILIGGINIFAGLFFNVVVALALYEVKKKAAIKAYQTVLFIPYFFSYILVGLMLTAVLNAKSGLLTLLIESLTGNKINFYAEPELWILILPVVHVWKGVGFGSLIYYSVLMSIDDELFEAAEIDGANKFQCIWHISVPSLTPMMCVLTIMGVGGLIKSDFGLFYYVTRNVSLLYDTTDTIDTYVFRALSEKANFSVTSAITLFQNAVACILIIATNKLARRFNTDYALY